MKRHNTQGFTLIELMVVVSLCALMAQLTIAYFNTFDSFIMQSELMSLRMFFQQMRYNAINAGKELVVTLDPIFHRYYTDNYEHTLPVAIRIGCPNGALGPPSSPRFAISSFITFKNNQIHFFPDGTMSSGIIYIVDRAKRVGYALSNGVGAVSYVRLYRYDKGRWIVW